MNIDLLLSERGETGLVSDKDFKEPAICVAFDTQSGLMTLEFDKDDPLDLNIPVGEELGNYLYNNPSLHIGTIKQGMITDHHEVPVMLQHDPFGGGNAGGFAARPRGSIAAFESFMKRCISGQPVHRDDLGDDSQTGSVLGGMSAAVLQFAPHLARQKTMEATPHLAPQAPGMSPGGGGGRGGVMRRIQKNSGESSRSSKSGKKTDDSKDQ